MTTTSKQPPRVDADRFPEWEPFVEAVEQRRPDSGTWCEAWTVRDIVVHQTGNAEELGRVLEGHLTGEPVLQSGRPGCARATTHAAQRLLIGTQRVRR